MIFFGFRVQSGSLSHPSGDSVVDMNALYRGDDKSLARPGRKQATGTEDFDVHISYLLS